MRGCATICDDTGWSPEGVREGVRKLSERGLLIASERPAYILVPESLAFDLPDKGNDTKGALNELAELPQVAPVIAARRIIEARSWEGVSKGVTEGVPEGLPTQEQEQEQEQEIPPKPPQGGGSLLLPGVKEAAPKPKRKRAPKALDRYAKNPTRAALAVFAHWHSKHPRADERMSPEQNNLIQRLLNGGYSVEDLCSVIDYTHASDWHIRNKKLGIDYCLRAKHVKDRVNAIKEHGSEGAAVPSEAPEERESYNAHQWFESEMSRAARRLGLAPEAVTIEWAGRHPLANTVPAWALERAVSNVRKERA
jgi:hypothetical protein